MSPQTRMSSRQLSRPAAGQGNTAFGSALHQVYDKARGLSNSEPRWVKNPRNGRRVGVIKRELGLLVFERKQLSRNTNCG